MSGAGTADQTGRETAISIVQRGNLKSLEQTLRKQWRLGQNIVLCWSADKRGLLVIFVPHYFLGNYCAATPGTPPDQARDNELFIRDLISGRRKKTRAELFSVAERLGVSPTFIRLKTELPDDPDILGRVEQIIKRYGISFVESRAVLLFDISGFSLYTPFEQASQLNSLSYSFNSAYNKLLSRGVEINFSRTTTGDGYYLWNRDTGALANRDLFFFMLLVIADNAMARAASKGNTVPVIRSAFHIGSHYELYQAEGVNPSLLSYIVGEVTIELARMLDQAQPHQILLGDFHCDFPVSRPSGESRLSRLTAPAFLGACNLASEAVEGVHLSGKAIQSLHCNLTTEEAAGAAGPGPARLLITDKHGLSRYVYNLQARLVLEDSELALGLPREQLERRPGAAPAPGVVGG